jgi:uncharacterized protein (TIGR02265 family)
MTRAMLFESLFIHGLRADAALAAQLRAEGVDLAALKLEYPVRVFNRCVERAGAHVYPGLPVEEARRQLGRVFIEGFAQTLLGKVVAVGMPLLGPVRYLKRFQDHLHMDSSPLRVTPVQLSERAFRMEFRNGVEVTPHFMAGLLEAGLRFTRTEARVVAEELSPMSFDLHITW